MAIARVLTNCVKCNKAIAFCTFTGYKDYKLGDELPFIVSAILTGAVVDCSACGTKNIFLSDEVNGDYVKEWVPDDL